MRTPTLTRTAPRHPASKSSAIAPSTPTPGTSTRGAASEGGASSSQNGRSSCQLQYHEKRSEGRPSRAASPSPRYMPSQYSLVPYLLPQTTVVHRDAAVAAVPSQVTGAAARSHICDDTREHESRAQLVAARRGENRGQFAIWSTMAKPSFALAALHDAALVDADLFSLASLHRAELAWLVAVRLL